MPASITSIWQEAAVVAILLVVLYTGHRGWWYWSPGVKALAKQLAHERDDWRTLAVTLLREKGIHLPEGFERAGPLGLPGDGEKASSP